MLTLEKLNENIFQEQQNQESINDFTESKILNFIE